MARDQRVRVGIRAVMSSTWALDDIGTGLLCGCVGIQRGLDYLDGGRVNLTFALHPQWGGHGYATRAVRLAMHAATARRPVLEFVVRVALDNKESIALARRAGFDRTGRINDARGQLIWLRPRGDSMGL